MATGMSTGSRMLTAWLAGAGLAFAVGAAWGQDARSAEAAQDEAGEARGAERAAREAEERGRAARVAQPTEAEASGPYWTEYEPSWTEGDFADIASMLIGTWSTSGGVMDTEGDASAGVVMSIHPAPVEGMTDTLYLETARADDAANPYRHAFLQLYRRSEGIHLRTLDLRWPEDWRGVLTGTGHVPRAFPEVSADDLIATLDQKLRAGNGRLVGSTPHAYPTTIGGAVEMASDLQYANGELRITDIGFDADGEIVWGGSPVVFTKSDPVFTVDVRENELIVLTLEEGEGPAVAEGDRLFVHYSGWLESGFKFDASRDRGREFQFPYPPRLIGGWNVGLDGVQKGTKRRLIIPPELGYGQRGQPAAKIPPDAPLYFDIEVLAIQSPESTDPEAGEAEGGEGQTGG